MDPKDVSKFKGLYETGKLLRPEQPGNVIARLSVSAGKELGGKMLRLVFSFYYFLPFLRCLGGEERGRKIKC